MSFIHAFFKQGLQACYRGFAPSRGAQGRARKLALPHLSALSIGRNHRCGSEFSRDFQFRGAQILFPRHVHRCSGIYHNFFLLWFLGRGCQHHLSFGRRAERGFVLCFELTDIYRQIPCFSKEAHRSCCKVSCCVPSSNFGAHGLRS